MKKKYLRKMLFEQFRRNSTNLTKFLLSFSVSFEIGSGVRLWSRAIEFEIRSISGPDSCAASRAGQKSDQIGSFKWDLKNPVFFFFKKNFLDFILSFFLYFLFF